MYRTVVTICTTSLTAIISLYNINWLFTAQYALGLQVQFTAILVLNVSKPTKLHLVLNVTCGTEEHHEKHVYICTLLRTISSVKGALGLGAQYVIWMHDKNRRAVTALASRCVTQQAMCLGTAPVGSNEVVENIWIIIDRGMEFRSWCLGVLMSWCLGVFVSWCLGVLVSSSFEGVRILSGVGQGGVVRADQCGCCGQVDKEYPTWHLLCVSQRQTDRQTGRQADRQTDRPGLQRGTTEYNSSA